MITIQILGSGAATPTLSRGVTAQYINFNERRILVDCGESTQLQLRKFGVKFQRLQYIFISHLHGDHYLGLPGLLASMHLLGRVNDLHVYGPPELETIINHQFELTHVKLCYKIIFHAVSCKEKTVIFEDNLMTVSAIPLKHRIPCYGYLFEEKEKERGMIKEAVEKFKLTIPEILALKKGEDIKRGEQVILSREVTTDPPKIKSYAFCTDTKYISDLHESIMGVDILYHEATFLEKEKDRAKATFHSTALQAARVANAAGAKQLLLGHFSARYKSTEELELEAKTVFDQTVCVNDGDKYII